MEIRGELLSKGLTMMGRSGFEEAPDKFLGMGVLWDSTI